jgi:hypothetical protein
MGQIMKPNDELARRLDDAYIVFSRYPQPSKLDASPLRDAKAILRTLTAAPLRELAGAQIGPYSGWAMTTVGTALDYKHFLPRILEEAVLTNEWMGTDPEVLAERLKMAEWHTWPEDEQAAVLRVFEAACQLEETLSAGGVSWQKGLAVLNRG